MKNIKNKNKNLTFFFLYVIFSMIRCSDIANRHNYSAVYDEEPPGFFDDSIILSDDTHELFSTAEIADLQNPSPSYAEIKDIPMGANYDEKINGTEFRLFCPDARKVTLCIYQNASDNYNQPPGKLEMESSSSGVWYIGTKDADPDNNRFYRYFIQGPGGKSLINFKGKHLSNEEMFIPDPYARANVQCDGHSIIIDAGIASLSNQSKWTSESFETPDAEDFIIYEAHINDMTQNAAPESIDDHNRGTYNGMVQLIPYLKDLGINCIELMPIHEHTTDAPNNPHGYSWGYLPAFFFAPESGYASDFSNGSSYYELRNLIKELHKNDIAVILDVVINHVSNEYNYLYLLDPGDRYYFHLNNNNWANLGTGNWIADGERYDHQWDQASSRNHPFAKKIIIDNLKYWVNEFKVDGFRFDLVVGTSRSTLETVRDELKKINPKIFLTSENWLGAIRHEWFPGNGFSQWNDFYRDSLKNFIIEKNNTESINRLKSAIMFSKDANDISGFNRADNPIDTINYIESHDEETIGHAVKESLAKAAIGNTILLTSIGIPMIYEGQELLRSLSKDIQQQQNKDIQAIDWTLLTKNESFYKYFRYLVHLRRDNEVFRIKDDPAAGYDTGLTHNGGNHAVGYVAGDTFIVLANMNNYSVTFNIPSGTWKAQCAVLGNNDPVSDTDLVFIGDGVEVPAGTDFDEWGASSNGIWQVDGFSCVVLKKTEVIAKE